MKTVIHVGKTIDAEHVKDVGLNAFATRSLAEAFSDKRGEHREALMIVERGRDQRPVYITVDSRPPEIVVHSRKVWGVWEHAEAQEPVAVFLTQREAEAWAQERQGCTVREAAPMDAASVQVTVQCILQHQGQVLLVRIGNRPAWTFPEGRLVVGETIDGAVRRACAQILGLQVGKVGVAAMAPYVNVYLPGAQHFLTLCMIVEHIGGEPALRDPTYSEWKWFPIRALPEPLFAGAQQFVNLVRKHADLDDVAPPPPPINVTGKTTMNEIAVADTTPQAPASPTSRKRGGAPQPPGQRGRSVNRRKRGR